MVVVVVMVVTVTVVVVVCSGKGDRRARRSTQARLFALLDEEGVCLPRRLVGQLVSMA